LITFQQLRRWSQTPSKSSELYREYAIDRESQKTLSIATSFLQSILSSIPYRIIRIGKADSTSFSLVASRDLNSGSNENLLLIDVLPPMSTIPVDSFINDHLSKVFTGPEKNHTIDRVVVIRSREREQIIKHISSSLHNSIIWEIEDSTGLLRCAYGSHFDKQLQAALKNGFSQPYDNFPNPYFPEMNPLLKLNYLTLNFNRKGQHNRSSVIEDAVRMAMRFSIYKENGAINADFSTLLSVMLKVGIASGSSRVSFPWSRTRTERMFLRRYYNYLEKASKTSLYDYDALF
jgi:hypothetical protein